jgi:hypothetical protein
MFEIPEGTWARRMAGNKIEILPKEIRLTIGLRDILVLKNSDDVPQIFGPTLMMPGQSFRLPFALASTYQFVCTAHASGQMTIVVEPFPAMPWARLRWRVEEFLAAERLRQEEGRADRSEIAQTQAPPIGSAARREGLREMANRGRAAPSARSAEGPAPGTLPSGG